LPGQKPKKRFSQNFLADKAIAKKIVQFLDIQPEDTVFEIGSGRGTLTELIEDYGSVVFSFELDNSLINDLNQKFQSNSKVHIINRDFLNVDPSEYIDGKFKLIGNIPYDITSPLISWIIQYHKSISLAAITTQKELGDRISSGPGSKNWAPISIFSQCYFDIKTVMNIPPSAFYPPPKIHSSTLVFKPKEYNRVPDWDIFERIVRASFAQRRKLLINNLRRLPDIKKENVENILINLGIDLQSRAEQLDINQFIQISEAISELNIS